MSLSDYDRCRPRNNGLTVTVREILSRFNEPISIYRISLETGIKGERIKRCLKQMAMKRGEVVKIKGTKGDLYVLYSKTIKPEKLHCNIAPRIEVGRGFRWFV